MRRSTAIVLVVLAFAGVAATGLLLLRRLPPGNPFEQTTLPSVLVMPFVNIGDRQDEFLSDGLAEDLIDSLTQISGLQVIARSSAFRFKGRNQDIQKIAGTLMGIQQRLDLGAKIRISSALVIEIFRQVGRMFECALEDLLELIPAL